MAAQLFGATLFAPVVGHAQSLGGLQVTARVMDAGPAWAGYDLVSGSLVQWSRFESPVRWKARGLGQVEVVEARVRDARGRPRRLVITLQYLRN